MQIDHGDTSTITTVEAPRVEQFAFHMEDELNRTLEVVQETYVQVRRVKLSQGTTIENDHDARVQIEQAFATQRGQFQEYVKHLETQFLAQLTVGRGEHAATHSEIERLNSRLRLASSNLSSHDVIIGELQEPIKRASDTNGSDARELLHYKEVVHRGTMENRVLIEKVKELETSISLKAESHQHDVTSGISKLQETLVHLGGTLTKNIDIVSSNTKCINNHLTSSNNEISSILGGIQNDTSDIRRAVHSIPPPSASPTPPPL